MSEQSPNFERQITAGPRFDTLWIWYSGGAVKQDVPKACAADQLAAEWRRLQNVADSAWAERAATSRASVDRHMAMRRTMEVVSKAVAFCHYARAARSPEMDRTEDFAERHWRDFEHDARMVVEVINKMVEREALDDVVAALPQLTNFMKGAVN